MNKLKRLQKNNDYDVVKIYSDEGISGGTLNKRPGLKSLLYDAHRNNFESVLIPRLSRLGRNARELLINVEHLEKAKIAICFIKESIDLSSAYGKFMLTMLAAMAELEKDISGESSVENKIARAKQGIPSTGKEPFGRKYNRQTSEWYLDPPDIKGIVADIADRYLGGENLRDIADSIPARYQLSYSNILKIFHSLCGDTWEVKFKKENKPILFNIPRLLSEEKIKAVQKRLDYKRTFNKTDRQENTFLLSGFTWCMECGRALTAQKQRHKNPEGNSDSMYHYYRHPAGKREKCRAITSIKAKKLEENVLNSIWENMSDEDSGFEEAWKDNYPDKDKFEKLKQNEKKLTTEIERCYFRSRKTGRGPIIWNFI